MIIDFKEHKKDNIKSISMMLIERPVQKCEYSKEIIMRRSRWMV